MLRDPSYNEDLFWCYYSCEFSGVEFEGKMKVSVSLGLSSSASLAYMFT